MSQFVDFVSELAYGSGVSPNYRTWELANTVPAATTAWTDYHLDALLPAFESWLAGKGQAPLVEWTGVKVSFWSPTDDGVSIPTSLDGSFTGITTEALLSQALHQRLLAIPATTFSDRHKAVFSQRFWGYLKWAQGLRRKFRGEIVITPGVLYDRDGTILTAISFLDVFNELHTRWHYALPATVAAPFFTPKLQSPAGQRSGDSGSPGEFFYFHRDHKWIYDQWQRRQGETENIKPYNMTNGWPVAPATAPSTWVEPIVTPWLNLPPPPSPSGNYYTLNPDANTMSANIGGVHGTGHGNNGDIGSILYNNYVPRFQSWHGWIDQQMYWREPRFSRYDTATRQRNRFFRPLQSTGAAWEGLQSIGIVRDPLAAADALAPANAISGWVPASGAGTLRMEFLVNESFARNVRAVFTAQVFNDAVSKTVPVETLGPTTRIIGTGVVDVALDTPFTVDFAFTSAFQSDSPVFNAASPVGFLNSRILITGVLTIDDGSDPGWTHTDKTEVLLVKEKASPDVQLYFNLSSFGEDQVNARMTATGARFEDAIIVTVQDRTTDDTPIIWPAEVAHEVKGLIKGYLPCAGIFADLASRISIALSPGTITGITIEPGSGPVPEDSSLPHNLPQRYTYTFDVVFAISHNGFSGLPLGGEQTLNLTFSTYDRANNGASALGSVKLFRAANPYMIDGDPPWLSIDTRVFTTFEGETKFAATLSAANPTAFLQQVITNLNSGSTGGDTFDGLPSNGSAAALVYYPSVTDFSTGTTRQIRNFALAKVRLQGSAGAADVRAFFRLFRYVSTNLIFRTGIDGGYRTWDAGAGQKIPLLGYDGTGEAISVPFFAGQRKDYNQGMNTQTDTPNVQTFPTGGGTSERTLYFGAYLDINDDTSLNARLPDHLVSLPAEAGGFSLSDVIPIRDILYDAHVCMVVEINYDSDPTPAGSTPSSSDNLAQRNLAILTSDNPGTPATHTVQHSFEFNTADKGTVRELPPDDPQDGEGHTHPDHRMSMQHERHNGHGPSAGGAFASLQFISPGRMDLEVHKILSQEMFMMMMHMGSHIMKPGMLDEPQWKERAVEVRKELLRNFPLTFDGAAWTSRGDMFDELLIHWNKLPGGVTAEIYFPGILAVDILNLRNLRHAPANVWIKDDHTLWMEANGITYLAIPVAGAARIPAVITLHLPENVKEGQRFVVDMEQLRGGTQMVMGAIELEIIVSRARRIADDERLLLELLFNRYLNLRNNHPWKKVLALRVKTARERARALAEAAGIEWKDPTVWKTHEGPDCHCIGKKVRVVLEKIQVLDDLDTWIKGEGEMFFTTQVFTPDNGGIHTTNRIPREGAINISDAAGENVVNLNEVLFEGYVSRELRVEVCGGELDLLDPDDVLGKYTRIHCGPADDWVGTYGPDDENPVEPEDMKSWKIWYRIERI